MTEMPPQEHAAPRLRTEAVDDAVIAELTREVQKLREALSGLRGWVEYELDLSHEHRDLDEGDITTVSRPEHVWRRGRMFARIARAALAENGDDQPSGATGRIAQKSFTREDLESDAAFRAAEDALTGLLGEPSNEEEWSDLYGCIVNAVLGDLALAENGDAERSREAQADDLDEHLRAQGADGYAENGDTDE